MIEDTSHEYFREKPSDIVCRVCSVLLGMISFESVTRSEQSEYDISFL